MHLILHEGVCAHMYVCQCIIVCVCVCWEAEVGRRELTVRVLLLFICSVMSDSLRPCEHQAHQASLSITNSRSLLKLMSIELVMPSNHLILCRPLFLLLKLSQA